MFCERPLLREPRILAAQAPLLVLRRFARVVLPGASELLQPLAEPIRPDVELVGDLGQAHPSQPTRLHQLDDFLRVRRTKRAVTRRSLRLPWPGFVIEHLHPEPRVREASTKSEMAQFRPGAQWLYAVRPARPAVRERRRVPEHRSGCHLMQFAIGWNVAPERRAIVRLTARSRGSVLREVLRLKTGDASGSWTGAGRDVREAIADMIGKDANGAARQGHRNAEFLVWWEDDRPTRFLVWRGSRPFDAEESEAVALAAARAMSWALRRSDAEVWKVRLVPLDRAVPPPPGFDGRPATTIWESVTPYVPPRRHRRGGKERDEESIQDQVRRELMQRGIGSTQRSSCSVFPLGRPYTSLDWEPILASSQGTDADR